MLTSAELLARIEAIRVDCADRAKPGYSGYINPSDADLAREDGARNAFDEVAGLLACLLTEARAVETRSRKCHYPPLAASILIEGQIVVGTDPDEWDTADSLEDAVQFEVFQSNAIGTDFSEGRRFNTLGEARTFADYLVVKTGLPLKYWLINFIGHPDEYAETQPEAAVNRQMESQIVYLLIRHYSDEAVGTFDTTEAVFADETAAELRALEMNEAPDRHPSCEYGVEPMPVT